MVRFSMEESWFPNQESWFPIDKCWFYNKTGEIVLNHHGQPASERLEEQEKKKLTKWVKMMNFVLKTRNLYQKTRNLHQKRGILYFNNDESCSLGQFEAKKARL